MEEKPIIFSGEMIKAILEGRKTMTRRPVKPQPSCARVELYSTTHWIKLPPKDRKRRIWVPTSNSGKVGIFEKPYYTCPYGQLGDRLWVRETWAQDINIAEGATGTLYYRANDNFRSDLKWKSPIFMPRWASRITLEIVNLRVERLWEITLSDIRKEGFLIIGYRHFFDYWNSLYTKKPEFQEEANPWVWVVEFGKPSQKPLQI